MESHIKEQTRCANCFQKTVD